MVLPSLVLGAPHAFADLVRPGEPPLHVPELDLWLVAGYQACSEVLDRPELFSSRESLSYGHAFRSQEIRELLRRGPGYPRVSTLVFADPPNHTRYRRLLESAFAPVTRTSRMAPLIQRIVDELIDRFARHGRCEFITEFAGPLPIAVIGEVLGVPRSQFERLRAWSDAFIDVQMSSLSEARLLECAEAILDFEHYMQSALLGRRQEPRDDLLSAVVAARDTAGNALSDQELISLLQQLLVGGNETTRNFLGNAVWHLAGDDELRDMLAADPRGIPRAVEDLLRLEPPLQGVFRIARQQTEVGGVSIPAGAKLMVMVGAANRDPQRFAPGFDFEHASAASHLAFGRGIHGCIGAPLARVEIRIALTTLLSRLPDMRLEEGHRLERAPLIAIRGFRKLWLRFERPSED
jgi:cytochrome P450